MCILKDVLMVPPVLFWNLPLPAFHWSDGWKQRVAAKQSLPLIFEPCSALATLELRGLRLQKVPLGGKH